MVFGIYRDRMIRIGKILVTLCKMFGSPEKRKLSKPDFMRDRSVFSWSQDGNVFDWHPKLIYGMFCFEISWYWLLFILVQSLWNRAWQVVQET